MTLLDLFRQLRIPITERRERKGWVHTVCPWCKHHHLGWSLNSPGKRPHCFFCGAHDAREAISRLASIPTSEAGRLLAKVQGSRVRAEPVKARAPRRNEARLPPGTLGMASAHFRYLIGRGFDRETAGTWGLMSTLTSMAEVEGVTIDWSWRIVIPVRYKGRLVNWQARAVGARKPKYLACPPAWEALPIRSCLYGLDEALALGLDRCVVVEGVTDVWRLGPGAVATFGVGYSREQIELLRQHFTAVTVLRDPGRMEWNEAERLAAELVALGLEAEPRSLIPGRDPGELSYQEARMVMSELCL